ncbi:hypothetical protein ACM55F_17520 [Flavobacterium sp. XS2P12]|uniref:hypothetical protein n=1 Tax=Flavobacterium melibiosi TaxID=3398734 RepID=UPI003A84219C
MAILWLNFTPIVHKINLSVDFLHRVQIIKIALHYEGLPAADGDILRRAINDKGRSKAALQKVKDNYFACCA